LSDIIFFNIIISYILFDIIFFQMLVAHICARANDIFAVISEKFRFGIIKLDRQAISPPSTFALQIFKVPGANFRMLDYAHMFARATWRCQ